ncbi:ATP-binding protein [Alkalibacter mobilis]|uniref:ATP-binding protein n=1 Tax=Alkalibacter mobilis TaxID=2787712 RepID=UPI00189D1D88|nr:ATP-binding protein [Alkalibacter mobilis]MBF7096421.1 ATP-binding protein [Alkalibacter mobilis]
MEIQNKEDRVKISLTLPGVPEFVSVARLTLSGIANRMGFNVDAIEDLKVAVSEACTNAMKHGCKIPKDSYNVDYFVSDKELIIDVRDKGEGFAVSDVETPDLENPKENGLGLYIIRTLMDQVEVKSTGDRGTVIRMIKQLEE